MNPTGTVIKSTGSFYQVRMEQGNIEECRILGRFRLDDIPLTNPVAVGDRVEVTTDVKSGQPMITRILPRTNYVVRQSPRRKHDLHLLASNIDQAVLMTTVVSPMLKPGFVDRFLLMAAKFDIPVTLVFNKADLYGKGDMQVFESMYDIYTRIGYGVILTSTVQNIGLDSFESLLQHKTTLLSGQSGVGKSSLVNAIQSHLHLRTGDISDYSGKGQHTTTFAEMHELSFGGYLIDTPGIKMLGFSDKDPLNVAHSYREMFEHSQHCKFGGSCLHKNEPGCAVKQAVEAGGISPLRYANYLDILSEVQDQNYWERHKDI